VAGKFGLGDYNGTGVDEIINSNANVCLLYDDALRNASRIKSLRPDMFIIGRSYNLPNEEYFTEGDPMRSYNKATSLCQTYPAVDAWAHICEYITGASPSDQNAKEEQYRRVRAQTLNADIPFADACQKFGKSVIPGNYGSGVAPVFVDQMQRWAPYLKRLNDHPAVKFHGMHIYGSDWTDPRIGGKGELNGKDPNWYALRYRSFYQMALTCGLKLKPLVFTEDGQTDGWRQWMNEEDCVADLLWFAQRMNEDSFVFGGCYFLCGDHDPTKWRNFNIHGTSIVVRLSQWNASNPAFTITTPVEVPKVGLALAILPSLQSYNTYVGVNSSEYGAMSYFANLLAQACINKGINAKVFHGDPDGPNSVANLIIQEDLSQDWAVAQPQEKKATIHLHSDSGKDFSHTFGIWSPRFPESEALAQLLVTAVQEVLLTGAGKTFWKYGGKDYSTYIYNTRAKVLSLLMELFSHENPNDVANMWARSGILADKLASVLAAWSQTEVQDAAYWHALFTKTNADLAKAQAELEATRNVVTKYRTTLTDLLKV
jgi:hypothetical protein